MPDYLVELQHAVEAVETRVPFGRFAVRAVLSLATLYALLFLVHSLWSEFIWPIAQFSTVMGSKVVSSLRSGSPLHLAIPNRFSAQALSVFVAGIIAGALAGFTVQLTRNLTAKIKDLETAVDKYASIFWQPLGPAERKTLTAALTALGPHSVQITAHENTDCVELASDIKGCFEVAGWRVRRVPLTGTWGSIGVSGFSQHTRSDAEAIHKPVQDALSAAVRGPMIGISGGQPAGEDHVPDVTILVGPKRIRLHD